MTHEEKLNAITADIREKLPRLLGFIKALPQRPKRRTNKLFIRIVMRKRAENILLVIITFLHLPITIITAITALIILLDEWSVKVLNDFISKTKKEIENE